MHIRLCSDDEKSSVITKYQLTLAVWRGRNLAKCQLILGYEECKCNVSNICRYLIMKWREYSIKLIAEARRLGYTETEIDKYSQYAYQLYKSKLPIIYDQIHVSLLVGYAYEYLLGVTNSSAHYYKTYRIPKRNGGERIISEPLTSLKEIQYWILSNILYKCKVSANAKAYVVGKSIRDNARFHKGQVKVLTIDITDFFPSISTDKIIGVFSRIGYNLSVSTLLAKLCTINDGLPQGAPTSPALSNLIFFFIDKRIFGYCKSKSVRYTRYADDMTFSGNFDDKELIGFVRDVLQNNKFLIKDDKTRIRGRHQQQEVTGVVVNEKIQVARTYRKKLRQEIYFIIKYGLTSHMKFINQYNEDQYIKVLIGRANFVKQINPYDVEVNKYLEFLHGLL